ncbi:MAG: glycosyltransferase [Sarcina sp.]
MKKILFTMPNLRGGGAEKVLIDILKNIDKSKFDVTLFMLSNTGVYLDEIPSHVKVKTASEKLKLNERLCSVFLKKFPRLFYKLNIKESFDVEIAFMEGYMTKMVANSTNEKSKKIAWVHIDLLAKHWTEYIFKDNEEEESCYNKFDDIIFVSKEAMNEFDKLFKTKASKSVIYNPIITEEIIKKSNEETINFEKFTIISAGRMDKQKGFDRLIKAHAQLVGKKDHDLVLLGQGPELEELKQLAISLNVSNSVKFLGFQKNPYKYIKAADFFVCSSRSEGYSLVVAESLVLEKPIITTNITGPTEVVNHGEYGMICESSEEGIRDAIEKFLFDKELLQEYREKSKLGKCALDYKKVIEQIESLF